VNIKCIIASFQVARHKVAMSSSHSLDAFVLCPSPGSSDIGIADHNRHGRLRRSMMTKLVAVFGLLLFLVVASHSFGNTGQHTAASTVEPDNSNFQILNSMQGSSSLKPQEHLLNLDDMLGKLKRLQASLAKVEGRANLKRLRVSLAQVAGGASGKSSSSISMAVGSTSSSASSACRHRVFVRYAPYFACSKSDSGSGQESAQIFEEKHLIEVSEEADEKEDRKLAQKLENALAKAEEHKDVARRSFDGSSSESVSTGKSRSSENSSRSSISSHK
jgi:hypothetical protein